MSLSVLRLFDVYNILGRVLQTLVISIVSKKRTPWVMTQRVKWTEPRARDDYNDGPPSRVTNMCDVYRGVVFKCLVVGCGYPDWSRIGTAPQSGVITNTPQNRESDSTSHSSCDLHPARLLMRYTGVNVDHEHPPLSVVAQSATKQHLLCPVGLPELHKPAKGQRPIVVPLLHVTSELPPS
jgi:hypothetical protein